MTAKKLPKFESLKEEREFWTTHDFFETLGEDGWEHVEQGGARVRSLYVAPVGKHGAVVRVPRDLLDRIGADRRVTARVDGTRLIVEAA